MDHGYAPRRHVLSGLDNSLQHSTMDTGTSTGTHAAGKSSFGLKGTGSPARAQAPTGKVSKSRPANSFGTPAQSQAMQESQTPDEWNHENLYEAYNDLHALAKTFKKPFDAPSVLVVGHQTDGKSGALSRYIGPHGLRSHLFPASSAAEFLSENFHAFLLSADQAG